MNNFLQKVEIPNFIDKVEISKKRRAKYYTKERVPKTMNPETNNKYSFNEEGILIITETGEKVVSNKRSAGKPRYWKISGQDIWSGINYNMRSKISREMKKYFYEKLAHLKPLVDDEDYPIGIRIDLYDSNLEGDVDNFIYLYRKTITDALCGNVEFMKVKNVDGKVSNMPDYTKYPPIIIDDSKKYVRDIPTTFHYVEGEDRKLVIEIYKMNDIR